jgi:hypothetical protein
VKKHHLLAVFSTVRLHEVQSTMNLRQVLEAGSCAAFAIANPDPRHFVTTDSQGVLNASQRLMARIYKWLDEKYPDGSKSIKSIKALINASTAHANLAFTGSNFKEKDGGISSPFFDFEDPYFIKTDLWRIGNIAISLLDLYYGVNQNLGVVKFVDDFRDKFDALVVQSRAIHAEMTSTDRYKAAAARRPRLAQRRKCWVSLVLDEFPSGKALEGAQAQLWVTTHMTCADRRPTAAAGADRATGAT